MWTEFAAIVMEQGVYNFCGCLGALVNNCKKKFSFMNGTLFMRMPLQMESLFWSSSSQTQGIFRSWVRLLVFVIFSDIEPLKKPDGLENSRFQYAAWSPDAQYIVSFNHIWPHPFNSRPFTTFYSRLMSWTMISTCWNYPAALWRRSPVAGVRGVWSTAFLTGSMRVRYVHEHVCAYL